MACIHRARTTIGWCWEDDHFHSFRSSQVLQLRVKGILQGQRVTTLIDAGATHNFIYAAMVSKKHIPIEVFEGFNIMVKNG